MDNALLLRNRGKKLFKSIRFIDPQLAIDTTIPIINDQWEFPQAASDLQIDGYNVRFVGYAALILYYDHTGITRHDVQFIDGVQFGSYVNLSDHNYLTEFDYETTEEKQTYGGIFACYEIPGFVKFSFDPADLQLVDNSSGYRYIIPCNKYNYAFTLLLNVTTNGFEYSIEPVTDFNYDPGDYISPLRNIIDNQTVKSQSYPLVTTTPLKQYCEADGYCLYFYPPDSAGQRVDFIGGDQQTIEPTDQVVLVIDTGVELDFTNNPEAGGAHPHMITLDLQLATWNNQTVDKTICELGSVNIQEQNYGLIDVHRNDTEYLEFSNTGDPVNGSQIYGRY